MAALLWAVFPSEWLLNIPLIMVVHQVTPKFCDIKQPPKVQFRNARKSPLHQTLLVKIVENQAPPPDGALHSSTAHSMGV